MVLLIDNYDSFVYNLARYINELGFPTLVKRNDDITIPDIQALPCSHIVISPGPCAPDQAGISMKVVQAFAKNLPILGVCLGHQAIAQAFGATIARAKRPMHGKSSIVTHVGEGIFHEMDSPLQVGRYHSLIVSDEDFPADLQVTARCEKGEIMAFAHREYPVFGVQFHPESVLTMQGYQLLRNFFVLKS